MESIRLIDISAAQGHSVDFDKVKASGLVVGVICKASQANGYKDPTFDRNFTECKRVGLVRGAYHFADADERVNDAIFEANFFVSLVRAAGGLDGHEPLFLVLDIESAAKIRAGKLFTDWVLAWCERVEELTGIRPWIYTGGPFFNQMDGTPDANTVTRLQRFPLWLAAYTNSPKPFLPPEWDHQELWQDTGDQAPPGKALLHVPGIGGPTTNVDDDVYYGTLEDLVALLLSLYVSDNQNPTQPDPGTGQDDWRPQTDAGAVIDMLFPQEIQNEKDPTV